MVAGAHQRGGERKRGLGSAADAVSAGEGLEGRSGADGVGKCGNKSSANIVRARASSRNSWRGVETLLRVTFAVRCAFWGATRGGWRRRVKCRAVSVRLQGVDEPVFTLRTDDDRPTSGPARSPPMRKH